MKSSGVLKLVSHSSAETQKLGGQLGRFLRKGDVVLLLANLGAGKTTLVQGLVKALGVREAALSPTFVIAQTFKAKIPIHHLDFYRLSEKEILAMGAQDYLTGVGEIPLGLVLIEWAERCKGLWPHERLEIRIRIKPRSQLREIKLVAHGPKFIRLVRKLASLRGTK